MSDSTSRIVQAALREGGYNESARKVVCAVMSAARKIAAEEEPKKRRRGRKRKGADNIPFPTQTEGRP